MNDTLMPALFLGHGSPMNAIGDSAFRRGWQDRAKSLPRPKGIVCVSAHWQTRGTRVGAAARPETIHDFGGFPQELFDVKYPAPGDAKLAERVRGLMGAAKAELDEKRGLDHGVWSVLRVMYPQADIPIVPLSLDARRDGAAHHELGRELTPLREEGILVVGSGNIVHNLERYSTEKKPYDWAVRFDGFVKEHIQSGDHWPLLDPEGADAQLAVPTQEHYQPLLYVLGLRKKGEKVSFFNEAVENSMSMTCVAVG